MGTSIRLELCRAEIKSQVPDQLSRPGAPVDNLSVAGYIYFGSIKNQKQLGRDLPEGGGESIQEKADPSPLSGSSA